MRYKCSSTVAVAKLSTSYLEEAKSATTTCDAHLVPRAVLATPSARCSTSSARGSPTSHEQEPPRHLGLRKLNETAESVEGTYMCGRSCPDRAARPKLAVWPRRSRCSSSPATLDEETTRGASLRELQRFFNEHDKDNGYAGLRRIADEDGTAVWTLLNETEVAAQLEKRAGERREEERRRDDLFSTFARTPSEATDSVDRLRAELEAVRAKLETARWVAEAAQGDKPSSGCCLVL